jgi:hypothetical protein
VALKTAHILGHVAGAGLAFLVIREGNEILAWLTWHVSRLLGASEGVRFYDMVVSADTRVGAVLTIAVIVTIPLLVVGSIAQATESLRRKWGYISLLVPLSLACVVGLSVWRLSGGEEFSPPQGVLGISFAILFLVVVAVYWTGLVGVLHVLRARQQPA